MLGNRLLLSVDFECLYTTTTTTCYPCCGAGGSRNADGTKKTYQLLLPVSKLLEGIRSMVRSQSCM